MQISVRKLKDSKVKIMIAFLCGTGDKNWNFHLRGEKRMRKDEQRPEEF
jgi:hypothetical protein